MKIDTPLYQQLVADLKQSLTSYHSNDRLPSERELTKIYHVSRNTVRVALNQLEDRGLIYRVHGKGTFVAPIFVNETDLSSMYSFSDQITAVGMIPSTKYLDFKIISAQQEVAKQLNLEQGDLVYYMVRLRLADDEPMMYGTSYLPVKLFTNLTKDQLERHSLYDVLKIKYHQQTMLAFEDVMAKNLTDQQAKILGVHPKAASLEIIRRTINDKNVAIEFTKTLARADKFVYRSRKYNDL